jgi:hypothetical protein
MSDEMWAAVCIIMEDQQVSSFKELTASHQAVIQRMDEMENKWAETQEARDDGKQGDGGTGTQGAGEGTGQGAVGSGGSGVPSGGGEGSPPPLVGGTSEGAGEGNEKKGSGRGGKQRWYERDGYAK